MGNAKNRAKKERWFRRGIDALQRPRAGVPPGLYCCPLCIHGFGSIDHLSFEDVPPSSAGGRRVLLTCRDCNSRSGHGLDHYVRKAANLREFTEGSRELRATLTADGLRVAATVRKTSEGLSFVGLPEHCNKEHHTAFFQRMDRAAGTGSLDWGFDMSLCAAYDPWAENLSWLRAGYLIAFAALGYTYIMRPELNQLRAQLASPDNKIIPYFMAQASDADATVNRLAIVFEPAELRSVLVQFGRRLIFLPDLKAGSDFFDRLKELPAGAMTQKLVVLPLHWPSEPVLGLDFKPRASTRTFWRPSPSLTF